MEIKSPTPQENVAETILYEIPNRYVPQVQSEMKAYGCLESWLLCSTAISASVIVVQFDADLWKHLWDLTVELYAAEKPNILTKLHESVKQLKLEVASSKTKTTKLFCKVPRVTGKYGNITVDPNFSSPYSPAPGRIAIASDTESLSRLSKNLSVNATSSFQDLRDPGKELLVFMITDKDRKQQKNIPYSYPVAYALKGSCMNNSHLQYMVTKVRTELRKRNITVLCKTYDGQWHKHITENKLSIRLTKLHGKETWNKCSALSKDKCIEEINHMLIVKKSTLQQIGIARLDISHGILFPGIRIEKGSNGALFIESEECRMKAVQSIHPKSQPDLFEPIEVTDENESIAENFVWSNPNSPHKKYKLISKFAMNPSDLETAAQRKQRNKKTVGLQENEESLLDIMKPPNAHDDDLANTNADMFQARTEEITLETILKSQDCPLLQNIINELSNTNPVKWNGKTADDIYPDVFTNSNILHKETTINQISCIFLLICVHKYLHEDLTIVRKSILNT